jgi:hypothetical protein
VKSFVELCYFTPRNHFWPKWMSLPGAFNSAVEPIETFDNMDQYDLVIAYLVDIEGRSERFCNEYPQIATYEVRVESLSDPFAVRRLFEFLRIETTQATAAAAQQRTNQRSEPKAHFANPVDLGYCQERVARYIEKAAALGIPVPTTLPLAPP